VLTRCLTRCQPNVRPNVRSRPTQTPAPPGAPLATVSGSCSAAARATRRLRPSRCQSMCRSRGAGRVPGLEDIYGAPASYAALEAKDTANDRSFLELGPWRHGGSNGDGRSLGAIRFDGARRLSYSPIVHCSFARVRSASCGQMRRHEERAFRRFERHGIAVAFLADSSDRAVARGRAFSQRRFPCRIPQSCRT